MLYVVKEEVVTFIVYKIEVFCDQVIIKTKVK